LPSESVGTHEGSAGEANGFVADFEPSVPTVFTPATKPTRRGSIGPRLLPAELLAS
jgi:hypothetical protein